ncbi:TetR/AcrR family transcriptional regulator [Amnibacterium flavum]|uniref:TetR family transcriptional regulator n=1 Tax=Amnibacterium flavum TaxID=2173173 RepID=A0A2V1HXJ5_9MICO|nr:TetR/AcrR family transcriptional regulator [Amnibacterium flavum]PVZ95377.1 TetR family transcriptional regulator [Amnibacterium flavum]
MPRTVGRPRGSESPTGLGATQDILFASAKLFARSGYGSTTTHAIAEAAGLRQPSIYHHFGGKKEILLALLLGTVQPSLDVAEALLADPRPAPARLWALCASDIALLSGGEVNLGELYLLPELGDPIFAPFHGLRDQLVAAYRQLVNACDHPDPELGASLVIGLVESIILLRRRAPESIDENTPAAFADAALRMLGLEAPIVKRAGEQGRLLIGDVRAIADAWSGVSGAPA